MMVGTSLTIDIGTTAIKLSLYQEKQLIQQKECRIQTYIEPDGKVCQHADELLESLETTLFSFTADERRNIEEIALSTAMHSLLPVFEDGYGEILIWSDKQSADTVAAFKQTAYSQRFYEKTGTPIHYMSPFSKLLWIKQTQPFHRPAKKWVGLKELITAFFTGDHILDYSTASATGLFNSLTMDWDDEILKFVSVNRDQLPKLVDTTTLLTIPSGKKAELGLDEKVKLLIGASDGCLAAYAGYLNTGLRTSLTLGTSGAVRKLSEQRQLDPDGQTFCYYLKENLWVSGGPTNNGGIVLEWLSQLFYDDSTALFDHLASILKNTPIGSNDLLFLPYINGERAPMWNPYIEGSFQGITMQHNRNDFIRAATEGILLNLKMIMDANQVTDKEISINGGVFRHEAFTQLTANILGTECLISNHNEPGFGLLGLLSKDLNEQLTPSFQLIKKENEQVEQYQAIYERFVEAITSYTTHHL
ncbi:gluconokinase [Enterococcus larvae]|uniref:gluconokinase n=1 Tax=Enterococcus larvae TaxID=2794352 RepID=UPI003F3F7BB0